MSTPEVEDVTVDFLILADRAEVLNGKLYMMGGGYTHQNIVDFSKPLVLSMALGVLVPWHKTNERHEVAIRIEDEDGNELEPKIDAAVEVGRPPQAVQGEIFRPIIAVSGQWKIPGPGTYRIVTTVGNDRKVVNFLALPAQKDQAQLPRRD